MNPKNLGGWAIGQRTFDAICSMARGKKLLELGSGTGSIELAKEVDLVSIENDMDFVNKYQGGRVVHVPLNKNKSWYDNTLLSAAIKDLDYDFILIDGPAGSLPRLGFYFNYHLFKKVPFLIDDCDRQYEMLMVTKFCEMGMEVKYINDGNKSAAILWEV
jgi:hypothetical protein